MGIKSLLFIAASFFYCTQSLAIQNFQTAKQLKLEDFTYEENIRTPLLYVYSESPDQMTTPPVIPVDQSSVLMLEFDEMGSNTQGYYLKVIHCDKDWTKSILLESEYLSEFINDYLITNYALSFNTKAKYVHYAISVPGVKLSGNFVAMVYRKGNPEDVILTKRFLVFDNKVAINPMLKSSQGIEERFTHQQIDFTIDYKNYPYIYNPVQEVTVLIRQNYRWDNVLSTLKPLYVHDGDDEKTLDYIFFNLENNFPGGNEFRMFDIRKIRTNGQNIDYIQINPTSVDAYIMKDKSRNTKVYLFYFDTDGKFIIANNEVGGNYSDPDYVNVILTLKTSEMPFGNIYTLGAFNDYKPAEKYKLNYDGESDTYKVTLNLKQGYYNYIYGVKSTQDKKVDEIALEGSFFQTENNYEIIVYHKPLGSRADLIIGYYSVKYNGSN